MRFDLQRLNSGERIAAGSALALFVCMFFRWFNFGFDTASAWDALHYISPILTVAIVYTLGVVAFKAAGRELGDLPGHTGIFLLGCLAALLVLFRIVDPVSAPGSEGFEASGSVEAGIFLGLLAAAGIAAGGYLASGGAALDQLREMLPSQAAAAEAPPPPAAAVAARVEYCEGCGVALRPTDRFCTGCGKQRPLSEG